MGKFLFVFINFVCLVFCLTTDKKPIYIANHEECVKVSGVDVNLLETMYEGNMSDDAKFKTYIHCFFKKSGFQSEDGEMHFEALKSSFLVDETEDIGKTIRECQEKKLKGDTPVETAFLYFKCLMGEI